MNDSARCSLEARLLGCLSDRFRPPPSSNEELGLKLESAGIQETMEFDEFLGLVQQLGKRSARTKEVSEIKAAIDMVTKGKPTINIDDLARIMGVVGMNAGEALNPTEVDDFKMQLGNEEEIAVDDLVQYLVDV
jgi:Ca2+-binding EF-hand superfamily protein